MCASIQHRVEPPAQPSLTLQDLGLVLPPPFRNFPLNHFPPLSDLTAQGITWGAFPHLTPQTLWVLQRVPCDAGLQISYRLPITCPQFSFLTPSLCNPQTHIGSTEHPRPLADAPFAWLALSPGHFRVFNSGKHANSSSLRSYFKCAG